MSNARVNNITRLENSDVVVYTCYYFFIYDTKWRDKYVELMVVMDTPIVAVPLRVLNPIDLRHKVRKSHVPVVSSKPMRNAHISAWRLK